MDIKRYQGQSEKKKEREKKGGYDDWQAAVGRDINCRI